MAKGIMLALSNPTTPDKDAEFNEWYNNTHFAEIVSQTANIPQAKRYKLSETQVPGMPVSDYGYAAVYDVNDISKVLPEMGAIKTSPGPINEKTQLALYDEIHQRTKTAGGSSGYMLVFTNPASPEQDGAFNQWYSGTHIDELSTLGSFKGVTRYKKSDIQVPGVDQGSHQYLAIYELTSLQAYLQDQAGFKGTMGPINPDARIIMVDGPIYTRTK